MGLEAIKISSGLIVISLIVYFIYARKNKQKYALFHIVEKFRRFRAEAVVGVLLIFLVVVPSVSFAKISEEDMKIVVEDTATDNLFRMMQARKFNPDVMFYVKGHRIFVHSKIHKGTELLEHSDITSIIMRNEDKRILFLIDGLTPLNTEILISQNPSVKIMVVNLEPPPN